MKNQFDAPIPKQILEPTSSRKRNWSRSGSKTETLQSKVCWRTLLEGEILIRNKKIYLFNKAVISKGGMLLSKEYIAIDSVNSSNTMKSSMRSGVVVLNSVFVLTIQTLRQYPKHYVERILNELCQRSMSACYKNNPTIGNYNTNVNNFLLPVASLSVYLNFSFFHWISIFISDVSWTLTYIDFTYDFIMWAALTLELGV